MTKTLNELECEAIEKALKDAGGDLTLTAMALGIGRATLYRKVKQYGIETKSSTRALKTALVLGAPYGISLVRQCQIDLNTLHKIQWDKKRQLKTAIQRVKALNGRIERNGLKIDSRGGALYIPWKAVQYLHKCYLAISRIQKDMNERKKEMKALEDRIKALKADVYSFINSNQEK